MVGKLTVSGCWTGAICLVFPPFTSTWNKSINTLWLLLAWEELDTSTWKGSSSDWLAQYFAHKLSAGETAQALLASGTGHWLGVWLFARSMEVLGFGDLLPSAFNTHHGVYTTPLWLSLGVEFAVTLVPQVAVLLTQTQKRGRALGVLAGAGRSFWQMVVCRPFTGGFGCAAAALAHFTVFAHPDQVLTLVQLVGVYALAPVLASYASASADRALTWRRRFEKFN